MALIIAFIGFVTLLINGPGSYLVEVVSKQDEGDSCIRMQVAWRRHDRYAPARRFPHEFELTTSLLLKIHVISNFLH